MERGASSKAAEKKRSFALFDKLYPPILFDERNFPDLEQELLSTDVKQVIEFLNSDSRSSARLEYVRGLKIHGQIEYLDRSNLEWFLLEDDHNKEQVVDSGF